jgi:hypothetical protein
MKENDYESCYRYSDSRSVGSDIAFDQSEFFWVTLRLDTRYMIQDAGTF